MASRRKHECRQSVQRFYTAVQVAGEQKWQIESEKPEGYRLSSLPAVDFGKPWPTLRWQISLISLNVANE